MHKKGLQESMIVSCEIISSVGERLKTVEMKKFVVHGTFLQMKKITLVEISESEYFHYRPNWWISHYRTKKKTFWVQPSIVYSKPFTPISWRTTTQTHAPLEVQRMEIVVEFFLHLVAMERILVVFLRIQRKSTKEDYDRTERPVVYRSLEKTSDEWLSRIHSFLLHIDRLQLTAVYCNRWWVWREHLKRPVFAMWAITRSSHTCEKSIYKNIDDDWNHDTNAQHNKPRGSHNWRYSVKRNAIPQAHWELSEGAAWHHQKFHMPHGKQHAKRTQGDSPILPWLVEHEDITPHRTRHRRTFFSCFSKRDSCARFLTNTCDGGSSSTWIEDSSLHYLESHLDVTCFKLAWCPWSSSSLSYYTG